MKLKIKELRESRGWTQDQMAAKVGLSRNYVSEIESGRKAPNLDRLQKFADAFGLSLAAILANPSADLNMIRLISALESASAAEWEAVISHAEALRGIRRSPERGSDKG